MQGPRLAVFAAIGTAALITSGCASTKEAVQEDDQSAIVETQSVGKLRKEAIDLNNDKQPDIWNYYTVDGRRRLVRKESDVNFDGQVDVTSHFENGQLVKEETDADFDGKVDWVDYYEDGERLRQESDTSFDGQVDVWKFFEDGKIIRKERDLSGDSRPDYFEYYQDQEVVRIGRDTDGDGEEDTWD